MIPTCNPYLTNLYITEPSLSIQLGTERMVDSSIPVLSLNCKAQEFAITPHTHSPYRQQVQEAFSMSALSRQKPSVGEYCNSTLNITLRSEQRASSL